MQRMKILQAWILLALTAHPRMLLALCCFAGVAGGLGGYTFRYAEGLSYLSNDPRACVNCHVMDDEYDSWIKSSHHQAATCNDCHLPHDFAGKYLAKARNGWNHSKAFTLQDYPVPIRITPHNLDMLQHNCIVCHREMVRCIASPDDVEQHLARCTDCHRSAGHLELN